MDDKKEKRKEHLTRNKYGIKNDDGGYQVRYTFELRKKAIAHYTNGTSECACCGFNVPDYLELDHIDGGGTIERVIAKNKLIWWVVRNGFPPGFQALCSLCNRSKGHRKECTYHKFIPKFKDRYKLIEEEVPDSGLSIQ